MLRADGVVMHQGKCFLESPAPFTLGEHVSFIDHEEAEP